MGEPEITYARLASFDQDIGQRTIPGSRPRDGAVPTRSESSTVYTTLLTQHSHPSCGRCGGLVDPATKKEIPRPLLAADCAVLRRLRFNDAFNPADFQILLTKRLAAPGKGDFVLPGALVRPGEPPHTTAVRALHEKAHLAGTKPKIISQHGHPRRDPRGHVISLLHFVQVDPKAQPMDVGGTEAHFFNLNTVMQNRKKFTMAFDHRELVYTASGWLRSQFLLKTVDNLFTPASEREQIISHTINPMFSSALKPILDAPEVAYENPWFTSGELKPAPLRTNAATRRSEKQQKKKRVSARNKKPEFGRTPSAEAPPQPRASSARFNSARERPQQVAMAGAGEEAVTEDDVPPPPPPPPPPEDEVDLGPLPHPRSAAADDGTAPAPLLHNDHVLLETSPEQRRAAEQAWAAADDEDDDDDDDSDDDVGIMLRGIQASQHKAKRLGDGDGDESNGGGAAARGPLAQRRSTPASRRTSIAIPDEEHPFLDDIDADFTNPLANS